MKILAVGGGSGGHVTPVVAVLRSIKKNHPRAKIRFWCDFKFANQATEVLENFDSSIPVHRIVAGKFRRYHHLSFLQHITWPSLVFKNLGDSLLVFIGFWQSLFKLIVWRPDVVFCKGGYVCLPVGVASYLLHIPIVVHDSDAVPGLTNRILSRFAKAIATGAPLEYYPYSSSKSYYTGIPVAPEFHRFSKKEQLDAKERWGLDKDKPLLVVTGGGLGATRINDAVVASLDKLQKFCTVVLVSGAGQYDELRSITPPNSQGFQLHAFISKDMAGLLGASDVVVARAGATTILELAALAKPTILIPNARLSGGHQIKNAAVYEKEQAVKVINEDLMVENPTLLVDEVRRLLDNSSEATQMTERFARLATPRAAQEVADIIIGIGNNRKA